MLSLYSTCAYADSYQNQNTTPSTYSNDRVYGNNTRHSNISDQDLTKKIRDKIGSGWFSKGYEQLTVQVNNGAVTLQGPVKTWDDKEKVEKEVRNIDGVKSLNSQLSVQEPSTKENSKKEFTQDSYATSSDDQLNKKIRDQISRGILWDSYKTVFLNTANGVVTLEGSVDSLKDQKNLIDEIQKIEGVKLVKSNLMIKKA